MILVLLRSTSNLPTCCFQVFYNISHFINYSEKLNNQQHRSQIYIYSPNHCNPFTKNMEHMFSRHWYRWSTIWGHSSKWQVNWTTCGCIDLQTSQVADGPLTVAVNMLGFVFRLGLLICVSYSFACSVSKYPKKQTTTGSGGKLTSPWDDWSASWQSTSWRRCELSCNQWEWMEGVPPKWPPAKTALLSRF